MSEKHSIPTNPLFKDLTKKKFGRWKVLAYAGKRGTKHYWFCLCKCGKRKVIRGGSLSAEDTNSCGCWNDELVRIRFTKHGKRSTPEYYVWNSMLQRCTNPNVKCWHNYGGRGIRVCRRWRNSFENFLKDMGPRPSPRHSLDRFPDNDGNYEPGNCRWALCKHNNRNRRDNHLVKYKGETRPIAYWSERFNITFQTLRARLAMYGWSVRRALETPVRKKQS